MPYTPYKGLTGTSNKERVNMGLARLLSNPKLANTLSVSELDNYINRLSYDYNQADGSWLGGNWISGYGLSTDNEIKNAMEALLKAKAIAVSKVNPASVTTASKPTPPIQVPQIPTKRVGSPTVTPTVRRQVTIPTIPRVNTPTKPFSFSPGFMQDINRMRGNIATLPILSTTPKTNQEVGNPVNTFNRYVNSMSPSIKGLDTSKYSTPITPNNTTRTNETGGGIGSILSSINRYLPTIGDGLAAYGTIKGMQDARRLTLENRATDTPNINAFKDYGKGALAENDNMFSYLQRSRLRGEDDLRRQSANAVDQIQSNVLSNGVKQSLLSANYADTLRGINTLGQNIDTQEMNLRNQRAALLQDIDRMVMQGEQARDLADRQDKDAFYTNLSRNMMDYATGLQHLGGMFNRHQENNTNNNLLAQLSQYGFMLDPKTGKLVKQG